MPQEGGDAVIETPDCTWQETISAWRDGNASIQQLGDAMKQAQKENEVKGQ